MSKLHQKVKAVARIELRLPSLVEVKRTSAHLEAATGKRPLVVLQGVFEKGDGETFSSALPVLGYSRGKARVELDGVEERVQIRFIEIAVLQIGNL